MPNWCDTVYKCVGDKKELESLYEVLNKINERETSVLKNGFGKWWLGNLVHELGENWEDCRCRGEITDYSIEDDSSELTICQSTAWCEQEGVRLAIEKKYPSIKVYFQDIEPGCENYSTNDSTGDYFPEKYLLCTDDGWEYFKTIEEVADYISDIIGEKVLPTEKDVSKVTKDYTEKFEDTTDEKYIHYYKFEILED